MQNVLLRIAKQLLNLIDRTFKIY